jgi:hypothetical protein
MKKFDLELVKNRHFGIIDGKNRERFKYYFLK